MKLRRASRMLPALPQLSLSLQPAPILALDPRGRVSVVALVARLLLEAVRSLQHEAADNAS